MPPAKLPTPKILIVGAGPTGLWLAYLLRLAKPPLSVHVIDHTITRPAYSKALSFSSGSLETFASFNLAHHFLAAGTRMPKAHFGGLPVLLEMQGIGAQCEFNLAIPQVKTEKILRNLCEDVGVEFRFGLEFKNLVQKEEKVEIITKRVDGGEEVRIEANWVVGCDGTHSKVRESIGIKLEGTASTMFSVLADIKLASPPPPGILSGKSGSRLIPLGDGYYRCTQSSSAGDTELPDLEDIKMFLREEFGDDYGAHSPLWISRFGNACRVATSFQKGRVILAGDSAHQLFPAGGQGMNLGFQDATSLAWRLAMIESRNSLNPELDDSLLHSYSTERVGVAKGVMQNVQAQIAIMGKKTVPEKAIRDVVCEMLQNKDVNALWARRMTGFKDETEGFKNGIQDDVLMGERVTKLVCGDMVPEVFAAMSLDKFVLLARKDRQMDFEDILGQWSSCVSRVSGAPSDGEVWESFDALLIRPDMRIAWVARPEIPRENVKRSLDKVLEYWLRVRV